ncbi:MAG: cytochrome c peroxidase [Verrucomicrobiales bacterium]|jgi:cytochrome c peroxidase
MKRVPLVIAAAVVLFSVTACEQESVEPSAVQQWPSTGASDGGSFQVSLEPSVNPIARSLHFSLDLRVEPASEGLEVSVNADMPAHRHGMNTQPEVTEVESGRYRVDGMLFHMAGDWVIEVEITEGTRTERVSFPVYVESAPPPTAFTADELREIQALSPLPDLPPSPTNAVADNPDAARFGQALFFDKRLSANGEISCATCHDPNKGFSDAKPLSEGLATTDRHSQSLWNVAYQRWFFWDGRADSLWAQSLQPLHSEVEMGATSEHARQVVESDPRLSAAYRSVFGDTPSLDEFVANLGKAIEAYERKIVSADSAFDRFVNEPESGHLSESARRGLKLFVGRGKCVLCHAGPNFSDGEFHNIGLSRHPDLPKDSARFVGIRKALDDRFNGLGEFSDDRGPEANVKLRYLVVKINNLGEFKTPTLRGVAESGPYMHDGRFATLRDVLDYYSELPGEPPVGHREETLEPLELSELEKSDLESFLRSLAGAPLDPSLTTSSSS